MTLSPFEKADRRLRTQFALSRVLATAASLDEGVANVLAATGEQLECAFGELWLVAPSPPALRCAGVWGATDRELETFAPTSRDRTFALGVGLPGRVWKSGAPTWVPDVVDDSDFARRTIAATLGLHCAMAFPVQFAGRTMGVIQFFFREARDPDEELLSLFADIGSQVGLFLERFRMGEELVQQARQILELSTPVLRIAPGILMVPVIGILDAARMDRLFERVLSEIVASSAHVVLLDVSAVPPTDTGFAATVGELTQAARLLGARVTLTGVSPALAKRLARLDVAWPDDAACATLAEGIRRGLAVATS